MTSERVPALGDYESYLEQLNPGGDNLSIKHLDQALHPDGSNFVELVMKSRIKSRTKHHTDHIIAVGIKNGKFPISAVGSRKLNIAEAFTLAETLTNYAEGGASRSEFTKVLSGFSNIFRSPARGMSSMFRRGNYENSGMMR